MQWLGDVSGTNLYEFVRPSKNTRQLRLTSPLADHPQTSLLHCIWQILATCAKVNTCGFHGILRQALPITGTQLHHIAQTLNTKP
jgi:hypothetical protein